MDGKRGWLIYLRKSKGRAGIARQLSTTTILVERDLGGYVAGVFTDRDSTAFQRVGGARPVRDDFAAMLARLRADNPAERGELPLGVASWHADRVARSTRDSDDLIEICAKGTHPLETVRGGGYNLRTANGRKNFTKDVVDAAFEVDHLIERIIEAKDEAAAGGRWLGGPPPFPYEGIPSEPGEVRRFDGIRPVHEEAQAVRAAATALLSGTSLRGVARDWNARGLTTRKGNPWRPDGVRKVMLSPRNAGIMSHHGTETGTGEWEPVLSVEVYRALRTFLGARVNPAGNARKWQGSGLYLCGACGDPVTSGLSSARDGRGGRRYSVKVYRCGGHLARRAEYVDEYVSELVCAFLAQPHIARQWVQVPTREDTTALQARIISLRHRMDELAAGFGVGNIDHRQLTTGTAANRRETAELEQRIAAAAAISPLTGLAGVPGVRGMWADLDVSRRQAVIARLMTVTIMPTGKGRPGVGRGDPGRDARGRWAAGGEFDTDQILINWNKPPGG